MAGGGAAKGLIGCNPPFPTAQNVEKDNVIRLAIVSSHPVQYYAPLFRTLATRVDLKVFYGHRATQADQANAGFGLGFSWDVDLYSGYEFEFLDNKAESPGLGRFNAVDTPGVGGRLKEGRYDAVLLTGWYLKCFHQALLSAKLRGLPVMARGDSQLVTPRSRLKVFGKSLVYPAFLRLFDAALYVGERNRAYWEHYGYPAKRLFHSPHCVDNVWFSERATEMARGKLRDQLGIASDTKLVLFAGKLVPFKRPLDVVEAIGKLRRRGVAIEMLVAGAGELDDALRNAALEWGVKLHMLGFCNQTEMPEAYAASDILVLPSNGRETWGLVVNEALASGRPVLISDSVGCAPDLARWLDKDCVFPVGGTEVLSERIMELLSMDTVAKTKAASGRFSLENAANGIVSAANFIQRDRGSHA